RFHQGHSTYTMGFAEIGEAPLPPLNRIDLPPAAAGDGAVEFSLDLYFGANTPVVLGIAPLIHYDSNIIEVADITNIAPAGLGKPDKKPSSNTIRGYKQDEPPPTIKIDGKLVTADTDTLMYLGWMDINEIKHVTGATATRPARIATIKFKWKAGAIGNTHIGITQSDFSTAHYFDAASILVRGPVVTASITAQPAAIDVTAKEDQFRVTCDLSRPILFETICTLELENDAAAGALISTIAPPINKAAIVIPPNTASNTRTFRIQPSADDNGRTFSIAIRRALANNVSLMRHSMRARISLASPRVIVDKSNIKTDESGERMEFHARLTARPIGGHVVVNVRSGDPSEAAVSPASLTFTADTWNTPQRVVVRGVDDNYDDGDKDYTIELVVDAAETGAPGYHDKTAFVSGTTSDDDEAMVDLTADSVSLSEADGQRRIVITAKLRDEVTFEDETTHVTLRKTTDGSATEGTDYKNFILPDTIRIPAKAASGSATLMITMLRDDDDDDKENIIIAATSSRTGLTMDKITLTIGKYDLDVDASGGANTRDAVTGQDGILIMRYLIGVRGPALTYGQTNLSPATIAARIEACMEALNVDKRGETDHRDGTLLARYLLGLRGRPLVDGIKYPIGEDPPDPADVAAEIEELLPE
ncbi:MAG: hypothetical protein OD918_11735, partial [Gammaproteobacteria bacterium]